MLRALLLVFACSCAPDQSVGEPPICESGLILDGSACVPESCGVGRWGNLPVDDDTFHVDGFAAEGGDGSDAAPFRSIQAGIEAAEAAGGGLVAVAGGTFPETLSFTSDRADIHVAGRCRELVLLDAGQADAPGIGIDVGEATVTVSGLTVRDSSQVGVMATSGQITIEASLIEGNTEVGVRATAEGTHLTLRDTIVRDTQSNAKGEYGRGIQVDGGASAEVTGCLVEGSRRQGVFSDSPGTRIMLRDTIVRDTTPDENGNYGRGVQAWGGSFLSADGCLIEGSAVAGLAAGNPDTEVALRDTIVRDTPGGRGVEVNDGATLSATRCLVEGSREVGWMVTGPGSEASLRDTIVRDTLQPVLGEGGWGIVVQLGGSLSAEGGLVEGNITTGLVAAHAGSRVSLRDVTIRDTQPASNGQYGRGIEVTEGATLHADGCLIEGNTEVGGYFTDPGTEVGLRDTIVRDTRPSADGTDGIGIDVTAGATLLAEGCLVEGNTEVGVLVDTPGTRLTLRDTIVRNTRPDVKEENGRGIEAIDGAILSAEGCFLEGNTTQGLIASDPGTQITLRDTTITNTHPSATGLFGRGIDVANGAILAAEGCLIDGNTEVGVRAADPGTEVHLRSTTVKDTLPNGDGDYGRGLEVSSGAFLSAESCLILGNTEMGVEASGAGTRVSLRDATVRDTKENVKSEFCAGVQAQRGATLTALGGLIDSNTNYGLVVENPGTEVTLRNSTVRYTRPKADGVGGWGIDVSDGASLLAEGCLIDGNTSLGILDTDPGSRVTLRDSTISHTIRGSDSWGSAAIGATVQVGASLSASQLVVSSNQGPGLLSNSDAFLECVGCVIQDNEFAGAAALAGATLTIADSTIEDTLPCVNLLGGAGLYAWFWDGAPPRVTVTDTLIRGNPVAGVWLIGDGTYVLTGNTIHGGIGEPFGSGFRCGDAVLARDGVTAWNGTTGLRLEDNVFRDASGSGVFLDASSAWMSGNGYAGNAMDLIVQEQSCDQIPDCYSEAPMSEICPTYSHPSCYAEFFFYALPAKIVE